MSLSEFDDFDDMMNDLLELAGRILGQPQGMALSHAPVQPEPEHPDEVIEGRERITYILHAPGYTEEQLRVSVRSREIEVATPDFTRRTPLHSSVDPATAKSQFRNGVLSVSVKKA
jgi:HSP20 family molecular chaperone IbpA